ncbi:MAG: Uma2 family endonuclease [Chloroflexota bacterium]
MATNPNRVVLTYEDLIEMPNDRQRYEIVDGELYVTAAPNTSHQTAVTNLTTVLNVHVRAHHLGRVFTAPYDVILEDTTVVEPDIIFVAEARKEIILPAHIRGAPDLVVEVLSHWTSRADRQVKHQAYARHGIASYWLLDPDRQVFTVNALADGEYKEVAVAHESERIHAEPFPDLVIELSEIWYS